MDCFNALYILPAITSYIYFTAIISLEMLTIDFLLKCTAYQNIFLIFFIILYLSCLSDTFEARAQLLFLFQCLQDC